jgi:signal transduction histidine kinase
MRAETQEQYAAFQACIAEMGASVLHNIGNAITGMTGHVLKLKSHTRPLEKLLPALTQFAEKSEQVARQSDDAETLKQRLLETTTVLKSSSESFQRIRQQFDNLNKLESGIRHIGDIISIQQSASRPVLSATRFNLRQLVDDSYSLIDERLSKYHVQWSSNISAEVTTLILPRNPLMQLLLNLLKNSLEAIITEMVHNNKLIGAISLSAQPYGEGQCIITITDNGCGIPAADLQKIFNPRYTTKPGGSGYGLHSAINFIRQIGGEIRAESDGPHGGARMLLTLPLVLQEAGSAPPLPH